MSEVFKGSAFWSDFILSLLLHRCLEVIQEGMINTDQHGPFMSGPPGLATLLPMPQPRKALLPLWRPLAASLLVEPALATPELCCLTSSALTYEPTFPKLILLLPKLMLPVVPGIHSWSFWFKGPRSHWSEVVLVAVDFSEPSPSYCPPRWDSLHGSQGLLFSLYIKAFWPLSTKVCGKSGPCLPLVTPVPWSSTMCHLSLYFRRTKWVDEEIGRKFKHFGNMLYTKWFLILPPPKPDFTGHYHSLHEVCVCLHELWGPPRYRKCSPLDIVTTLVHSSLRARLLPSTQTLVCHCVNRWWINMCIIKA